MTERIKWLLIITALLMLSLFLMDMASLSGLL